MGLALSRPRRETSEGCLGFVGGMKKTLDRSALQLEALCLGLGRPGLCTHTPQAWLGLYFPEALSLPPWKRMQLPLESAALRGLLSCTS